MIADSKDIPMPMCSCHAIADALLGAIGESDIGHHFPNTDEGIRGISSLEILRRVRSLLAEKNARADQHRRDRDRGSAEDRAAYSSRCETKIAAALACEASRVSIKATTNEGLGIDRARRRNGGDGDRLGRGSLAPPTTASPAWSRI